MRWHSHKWHRPCARIDDGRLTGELRCSCNLTYYGNVDGSNCRLAGDGCLWCSRVTREMSRFSSQLQQLLQQCYLSLHQGIVMGGVDLIDTSCSQQEPIKLATYSQFCAALHLTNTGILGSVSTRYMGICLQFMMSCLWCCLAMGRSPN
jgi:hypothetical protein